jgi:hypothetical protein
MPGRESLRRLPAPAAGTIAGAADVVKVEHATASRRIRKRKCTAESADVFGLAVQRGRAKFMELDASSVGSDESAFTSACFLHSIPYEQKAFGWARGAIREGRIRQLTTLMTGGIGLFGSRRPIRWKAASKSRSNAAAPETAITGRKAGLVNARI